MSGFASFACLMMSGCGGDGVDRSFDPDLSSLASPTAPSWEEFRGGVFREPDTGIFIVDGDVPVTSEEALREFYVRNAPTWGRREDEGRPVATVRAPLAINRVGNADDRWPDGVYLTYCVSTSFGTNYGAVVTAMNQASSEWNATANVTLVHRMELDGNCNASTPDVVFDVRPTSGASYIARAFFPSTQRPSRNILIDTSNVPNGSPPWSLTGVLRHELGHGLGFRHEHTRPEARACFEDNNWRALTTYDAASVMHYPQCRGTNRADLTITALDAAGAVTTYGPRVRRAADLVWRHNVVGQTHYWAMADGRRTAGFDIHTPVTNDWTLRGVGDVDGDRTDDLVWQHANGQVHYWPMAGGRRTGGFDIHTPVGPEWTLRGIGDVTGDGTDDLVWQHANGQVHYWSMVGGRRTGGFDIHTPVGPDWTLRGVGDVDGSGTDDLVWQHAAGQVHYWPMAAGLRTGGIDIHTPVSSEWTLRSVGDVSGDGTDDLVWQHAVGQVHYWPMVGGRRVGGFDIHTPVGPDWTLAGAGDVNGW